MLKTKLFIPPIRATASSVLVSLNRSTCGLDKALVLISAPAGYGKTTLVSSWLREINAPSAWLSLEEGDNDPIRFLQYLIAALERIIPTLRPDSLGLLQGMQPAPFDALTSLLINEIAENSAPFVLVPGRFSRHPRPTHSRDARLSFGAYATQMHLVLPCPHRPASAAFPPACPGPIGGPPGRPATLHA